VIVLLWLEVSAVISDATTDLHLVFVQATYGHYGGVDGQSPSDLFPVLLGSLLRGVLVPL
jgi:hypothetical protein